MTQTVKRYDSFHQPVVQNRHVATIKLFPTSVLSFKLAKVSVSEWLKECVSVCVSVCVCVCLCARVCVHAHACVCAHAYVFAHDEKTTVANVTHFSLPAGCSPWLQRQIGWGPQRRPHAQDFPPHSCTVAGYWWTSHCCSWCPGCRTVNRGGHRVLTMALCSCFVYY